MAVSAENLILGIIKETTAGITPAAPSFLETSIVSESLVLDGTFTESEMIQGGTRGVRDVVLTQVATSGDIVRELVYELNTDLLLEALLGNTFGNDPHSSTPAGNFLYDYTDIITLAIEKKWDVVKDGANFQYHNFNGQLPASGSIEFAPGEIVSHSTSFVGMSMVTADDAFTGAVATAPEAGNPPMTSPHVTDIAITILGTRTPVSWMSGICFTNLVLAFENNSRALACIGGLTSRELALGRLNVTGTGTVYYAADDPLDSLLLETEYGLLVKVEDTSGVVTPNMYEFFMPRVKFTVANVNATGQSTDVMTEFTVQALQDTALKYTIVITKTDSTDVIAASSQAPQTIQQAAE